MYKIKIILTSCFLYGMTLELFCADNDKTSTEPKSCLVRTLLPCLSSLFSCCSSERIPCLCQMDHLRSKEENSETATVRAASISMLCQLGCLSKCEGMACNCDNEIDRDCKHLDNCGLCAQGCCCEGFILKCLSNHHRKDDDGKSIIATSYMFCNSTEAYTEGCAVRCCNAKCKSNRGYCCCCCQNLCNNLVGYKISSCCDCSENNNVDNDSVRRVKNPWVVVSQMQNHPSSVGA
jgi:hypothetical protein